MQESMRQRPARVLNLILTGCFLFPAAASSAAADNAEKSFKYDPRGRRDPFSALVRDGRLVGVTIKTVQADEKPILHGILWDAGGHSIALINDTEARVGETIGGYEIIEIRRNSVIVSNGGEPVVLEIAFDQPAPGATKGGERP